MDIVQARLLGFPIDPIIKKEIMIKTTKFLPEINLLFSDFW